MSNVVDSVANVQMNSIVSDEPITPSSLKALRSLKYHDLFVEKNIFTVKEAISNSVNEDTLIIQSISAIDEIDKIINVMSKRLREWYGYYFPELSHAIADNELFVKRVLQDKKELMIEYDIKISMGNNLQQKDVDVIINLARQIGDLFDQRSRVLVYLEEMLESYCKNIYVLCGGMIAAKLLEKAKSLRKLAMLPSSTIQLLGAEQALFRHLRNKRIRPPKHGLILSHQYVNFARDKGRAARKLAAKICIAAKVDYFKGEFIADKLKEDLK